METHSELSRVLSPVQLIELERLGYQLIRRADLFRIADAPPEIGTATIADIAKAAAADVGATYEAIIGHHRGSWITPARQAAMYVAHNDCGHGLSKIARVFADRNHSSVAYAINTVKKRIAERDHPTSHLCDQIRRRVGDVMVARRERLKNV